MNAVVYKDGKLQIETIEEKENRDAVRSDSDIAVDSGSTGGNIYDVHIPKSSGTD